MIEGYTQHDFHIITLPASLLGLLIYFLPTLIVFGRQVENKAGVILLNLFLGWTVVGWFIALVMALSLQTKSQSARTR